MRFNVFKKRRIPSSNAYISLYRKLHFITWYQLVQRLNPQDLVITMIYRKYAAL